MKKVAYLLLLFDNVCEIWYFRALQRCFVIFFTFCRDSLFGKEKKLLYLCVTGSAIRLLHDPR